MSFAPHKAACGVPLPISPCCACDNDKIPAIQINKSEPIWSVHMLLPSTVREQNCSLPVV